MTISKRMASLIEGAYTSHQFADINQKQEWLDKSSLADFEGIFTQMLANGVSAGEVKEIKKALKELSDARDDREALNDKIEKLARSLAKTQDALQKKGAFKS